MMNRGEIKTERILKTLNHQEPDQVPISDFFWTGFLEKWRKWIGNENANIYEYYDLDMMHIAPNMEPKIMRRQIIEETQNHLLFRSGFGSILRKKSDDPMPYFVDFAIKSADEYESYELDDPLDDSRYYSERDDIINSGDTTGVYPSFMDSVREFKEKICITGSVTEPYEYLWRARGTEGALMDLALYPEKVRAFCERITDFMIAFGRKQIRLGGLKVMFMWGDVAYDKGMFFSPRTWKEIFYPCVKRLCSALHEEGVKIIYHGCGNALVIFDDLIDAGIDAYNPLEVKAGLDVVELKRKFKNKIAFTGNIDNSEILAYGTEKDIEREVLRKLNAAKNGGYIVMSDHSVASNVPPENYDRVVRLVREYGKYPLNLGAHDEDI